VISQSFSCQWRIQVQPWSWSRCYNLNNWILVLLAAQSSFPITITHSRASSRITHNNINWVENRTQPKRVLVMCLHWYRSRSLLTMTFLHTNLKTHFQACTLVIPFNFILRYNKYFDYPFKVEMAI
jgi:hypothetical protein